MKQKNKIDKGKIWSNCREYFMEAAKFGQDFYLVYLHQYAMK